MGTDKIIVVGKLCGGPWDKRYNQIRSVYDPDGIAPTLCAGMGGGGGVVPKILIKEEDGKDKTEGR